jgi:AraC-like DNA-binding protein
MSSRCQYLEDKTLSSSEIAYLLGFTETSSFSARVAPLETAVPFKQTSQR